MIWASLGLGLILGFTIGRMDRRRRREERELEARRLAVSERVAQVQAEPVTWPGGDPEEFLGLGDRVYSVDQPDVRLEVREHRYEEQGGEVITDEYTCKIDGGHYVTLPREKLRRAGT